jgi:trimeric autotransporter adhesin
MLNLASDGSDHLTSVQNGVLFDLNARGVRDQVAWTRAGFPVSFLVLDRNGNGVVDDGRELFGTATLKRDGTRAANGFDALYDLDGGEGVSDWLLDGRDALYDQLRLWIDRNHNGLSEPDELLTLRQAGVVSLSLSYTEHRYRDRFGNWYRYESHAVLRERGHDVTRRVFDIFLKLSAAQPQS